MSQRSDGRRKARGTVLKLGEVQWLAPLVMARRLAGLSGATPMQAWFAWQRWAVEKACVFSAAGMAMAQETVRTALDAGTTRRRGAAPASALEKGMRVGAKALAPLHRRVKRNARKR